MAATVSGVRKSRHQSLALGQHRGRHRGLRPRQAALEVWVCAALVGGSAALVCSVILPALSASWRMGTHHPYRDRDLSAPGCYFITFNTAARHRLLGQLRATDVRLSGVGKLVVEAWNEIGHRFPTVSTGAFVVMPDHVHGIVWWSHAPRGRRPSIPKIVNAVKGTTTQRARAQRLLSRTTMLWQRSFHVRGIDSERAKRIVERYIVDNPSVAWQKRHAAYCPKDTRR